MPVQYRPQWSIPGAGPSESVINWEGAPGSFDPVAAAIRQLFADLISILPNEVTISFPAEMTVLDDLTGDLTDVVAITPPASVSGGNAGGWAGGVGGLIQWESGIVEFARRQNGRTFIVPLASAAYDTNGTLTGPSLTALSTVADDLIDDLAALDSSLVVWSRTHGQSFNVVSSSVPDRTAILRQRRD